MYSRENKLYRSAEWSKEWKNKNILNNVCILCWEAEKFELYAKETKTVPSLSFSASTLTTNNISMEDILMHRIKQERVQYGRRLLHAQHYKSANSIPISRNGPWLERIVSNIQSRSGDTSPLPFIKPEMRSCQHPLPKSDLMQVIPSRHRCTTNLCHWMSGIVFPSCFPFILAVCFSVHDI